jgi:NHL repeat-containing protein/tail protein P2 I
MAIATNQYTLLDSVTGWRMQTQQGSRMHVRAEDGALVLPPLPGEARPVLKPEDNESSTQVKPGGNAKLDTRKQRAFLCPSATAPEPCGSGILVVDASRNDVKRVRFRTLAEMKVLLEQEPSQQYLGMRVENLSGIGGLGIEPRRFRHPRGVASLRSGAIVVSDTGNHRVQFFSPSPYALLQVWGATDAQGNPRAGQGPKEFEYPSAVVVDEESQAIYVADQGNGRVQQISFDGLRTRFLGEGVLGRPTRLALGPKKLLAVLDEGTSRVFLFSPQVPLPGILSRIEDPRSVAFDPEGTLYVGNGKGRLLVFRPRPESHVEFDRIDESTTRTDGAVLDLAWVAPGYLIATIRSKVEGIERQTLTWIKTGDNCVREQAFTLGPLDSQIDGCQWHRLDMHAVVPEGTSVQVATYTAETQAAIAVSGTALWQVRASSWKEGQAAGEDNPDWLVQSGPGRFLWLKVVVRSNGKVSPSIEWIKAFYPRNSYLHHLPAVYQEDEESRLFLDRFLSIFQHEYDKLDWQLDNLWQLFEPGAPASAFTHDSQNRGGGGQQRGENVATFEQRRLQWLAAWLGRTINPAWTEGTLRTMLRNAAKSYAVRGTVAGLESTIRDYGQVSFAKILEHYRLRRWPVLQSEGSFVAKQGTAKTLSTPLDGSVRIWSPDFYQRFQVKSNSQVGMFRLTGTPEPLAEPFDWGAHTFSVFYPTHPYTKDETEKRVRAAVEREKPAHTRAVLCPVFPRLRVGIQATVGVNTMVGGVTHTILGKVATLSYDTILGCSEEERGIRRLNASPRPRVGISTRLS